MTHLRSALSVAISIAVVSGCASATKSFDSKREPNYDARLERLLIIPFHEEESRGRLRPEYYDRFIARLQSLLDQRGVASQVGRPDKQEVEERAPIRSLARVFRPRQVLHFGITRIDEQNKQLPSPPYGVPAIRRDTFTTFSFRLVDVRTDSVVWRGDARYDTIPSAELLAEHLFEQLSGEDFLAPR